MLVREIVAALGGAPSVAEALGMPGEDVGAKAVRAWVMRNSIPAEWFSDIEALATLKNRPEIDLRALSTLAKGKRLARSARVRHQTIVGER